MESYLASSLRSICNGYTIGKYKKQDVFFKHFGLMDHVDIEAKYHESLEWAKSNGLLDEKEQLEFCIQRNLWKSEYELEIATLTDTIKIGQQSLAKALIGAQKIEIKKSIDDAQLKLTDLLSQRIEVLGTTADDIGRRRSNDFYILKSVYKDKELTQNLYLEDDFEYIEVDDLQELIVEHNDKQKEVSTERIKKIVIAPFFTTLYRLVKDPHALFDRPILNLTYTQIEFLNFAELFKRIFSESEVPENIRNDADKIIEWYQTKDGARNIVEQAREKHKDGGAVAILGATKEELSNAGIKDGMDLHKALRQKGKANQEEMMKLLGLNK